MRAYAPRYDGDVELWGLTGLMHDLDYERYPNLEDGHPRYAIRELEDRGYDAHGWRLGTNRGPSDETATALAARLGALAAPGRPVSVST